jgi:hypothetical protein
MPARSRAARLLAVLALLVATGLAPVTVVAVPTGDVPDGSGPAGALGSVQSTTEGNTTFHVDVASSGDVEWTITLTTTPPNGSDADLDAIATEYEDGDTPYLSIRPFEVAAGSVAEATGREMEITDVDRDGRAHNGTLALSLSFTWTNFAEQVAGDLAIRDVFQGETGRWFGAGTDGGPGLTAQQRLVIEPPADYDISSVSSDATIRNGMIRWEGPIDFGSRTSFAVFSQPSTPGGPPSSNVTTTTTTAPAGPNDGDDSSLLVPLVLGFVGVLALVTYVMRRDGLGTDASPATAASDGDTAAEGADPSPAEEAAADADGGEVTGSEATEAEPSLPADDGRSAADGDTAADAAAAGAAAEDDGIDEELLSDEERVERLLERNGGRMKQANIVSETGWSNAKVSQLLSSMDDDGRIEKLRIGRENLISFPDEDITGDNDAD